jgi:hypothetical protein
MRIIALFIIAFTPLLSNAQFDFNPDDLVEMLGGTMETDRPGQAMNPRSCGIMTLQLQTGGSFARSTFDPNTSTNSISIPTQLKLGLTAKLEFNSSFSFLHSTYQVDSLKQKFNGFPSPSFNLRYTILSGNRWKPYIGIQAGFSPSSTRGTIMQPNFGSSYHLLTSNRFENISINTNIGLSYGGYGNGDLSFYSIPYVFNLGYTINSKWSAFAEAFGNLRGTSLALDGGFAYAPSSTLQLDAYGGWLGGNSWFAEIGVTWKYSFLKALAKKKINEILGGAK